jgi:hypothetical protein
LPATLIVADHYAAGIGFRSEVDRAIRRGYASGVNGQPTNLR